MTDCEVDLTRRCPICGAECAYKVAVRGGRVYIDAAVLAFDAEHYRDCARRKRYERVP